MSNSSLSVVAVLLQWSAVAWESCKIGILNCWSHIVFPNPFLEITACFLAQVPPSKSKNHPGSKTTQDKGPTLLHWCLVSHNALISFEIMYLCLPWVSLVEHLHKPPSLSWTEELIVSLALGCFPWSGGRRAGSFMRCRGDRSTWTTLCCVRVSRETTAALCWHWWGIC